jgi:hypothetical protein
MTLAGASVTGLQEDTPPRSAAHLLLQALIDADVEYVFANLGTDHAPIIEELARWRAEGLSTSCCHARR